MTTETGLRHPALRALLARWRAHRGAAALPSPDDLPFINLGPWRGRVRRVEVAGGELFRLLPCAHARIEPVGDVFDAEYRSAVRTRAPAHALLPASTGWQETLVLPFAGRDQQVGLLLVCSYASSLAEEPNEGREQQRQQRRPHENLARRALEKA